MQPPSLVRYLEWKRARDEKFEKTWPLKGQRKPWRFVMIRGVLMWALPIIVTLALVSYSQTHIDTRFRIETLLALSLVVLLFGVAYGWFQWWVVDRGFKKMKRNPLDSKPGS